MQDLQCFCSSGAEWSFANFWLPYRANCVSCALFRCIGDRVTVRNSRDAKDKKAWPRLPSGWVYNNARRASRPSFSLVRHCPTSTLQVGSGNCGGGACLPKASVSACSGFDDSFEIKKVMPSATPFFRKYCGLKLAKLLHCTRITLYCCNLTSIAPFRARGISKGRIHASCN